MLSMKNGCPRWSILALPLLAAWGCSDPVPRPAQGNLTLSIQPPVGPGNCPVPGITYEIGNPKGPNTISPGDRLIDGEHAATIKCAVNGSSTFTFSGTVKGITNTTPSSKVAFQLTNGVINTDKMTGTATVAVNTNDLAANFTSPAGGCTVGVVGDNVKAGSLWATVTCPTITDPTAPGRACSVGSITTFVLENCEGS
jgi:hypothetical protein